MKSSGIMKMTLTAPFCLYESRIIHILIKWSKVNVSNKIGHKVWLHIYWKGWEYATPNSATVV